MSTDTEPSDVDSLDDHVDAEIAECLSSANPKSFFLFAGAGSGKTRSLVAALEHIQSTFGDNLRNRGQRVGVITFTNAAADEIKRRIQFDPLIDVRTIHSFAWSLIDGLDHDIRGWLKEKLAADIDDLRRKEAAGRAGKASTERKLKIESSTKRLEALPEIRRFIYSPTGTNRTRDSLNHAEVIQLTAHFLQSKPRMRSIFVGRYPILLVDESQDTNKHLVDALFEVEALNKGKFSLGLIGDMMQRIYSDGKDGLGTQLPDDWIKPSKQLNHRCPRRVITLLNKVRSVVDKQEQKARSTASEGVVRFFVIPSDQPDKPGAERSIARFMAELTADDDWVEPSAVKTLTLEHRMAAARMGFLDIFVPLYEFDSASLLNGTLSLANFFTDQILPTIKSKRDGDRFALARLVKLYSPLFAPDALRKAANREHLTKVQNAVDALFSLWDQGADPTLLQVLRRVTETGLFEVPESLAAWASEEDVGEQTTGETDSSDRQNERNQAIEKLLGAPFSQVEPFAEYLAGRARFDTHQGVKGLEFERVMVIMDDSEARGFLFKYEDLFGGKLDASTTVESTRRLFYVTASRAEKSLALVAYSSNPDRVRRFVLDQGWFGEEEIINGVPTESTQ